MPMHFIAMIGLSLKLGRTLSSLPVSLLGYCQFIDRDNNNDYDLEVGL